MRHNEAARLSSAEIFLPLFPMNQQQVSHWLKTSLVCPEMLLEAVTDLLGVLSGSAVEQSPTQGGQSTVSGFFHYTTDAEQEAARSRLEQELAELFAAYNLPAPPVQYAVLADEDWATSWKQFFTPFAIAPGLVIKPSWESYTPKPGEQVLEIDPGMAFGTGQHASTKLALGLVQSCLRNGPLERVLDVGTGTGILAMAAALFGAKVITAIDNDPEAVQAAAENIALNGLEHQIAVAVTPLSELHGSFNLICANILHDVLVELAPALVARLVPQGQLVLAGLLRGEQEESIVSVYGQLGLTLQQAVYEEDWVALLLRAQ
ncbi:50S ribosomal protein L11 methyltransferase [Candidatus Electronema sp. PJ]|uniref:50S ribosomal protein L11 methyltransferase n=1 Tax=Candidatus Electronema sp. PJ TaxID=3401572 RepID=UPI003AA84D6A